MTWPDRAGDNRFKLFVYKLQIGKPFSFHFSGLRNRLLTLRRKTEVFDLEFKSNDFINNCIECMMCFCSGSAARLKEESQLTQPPDQVRHHALSRVLSNSATFSDCFLLVFTFVLCRNWYLQNQNHQNPQVRHLKP